MNFIQKVLKSAGADFVDVKRGFSVTTEMVVWRTGFPYLVNSNNELVCIDDMRGITPLTPKIKKWMEE